MCYVYILEGKNGRYYIGCSVDVFKRLEEHNSGKSKATRNNRPYRLLYCRKYATLGEARKDEKYLKRQKSREVVRKYVKEIF